MSKSIRVKHNPMTDPLGKFSEARDIENRALIEEKARLEKEIADLRKMRVELMQKEERSKEVEKRLGSTEQEKIAVAKMREDFEDKERVLKGTIKLFYKEASAAHKMAFAQWAYDEYTHDTCNWAYLSLFGGLGCLVDEHEIIPKRFSDGQKKGCCSWFSCCCGPSQAEIEGAQLANFLSKPAHINTVCTIDPLEHSPLDGHDSCSSWLGVPPAVVQKVEARGR
jgi:hypothetical protein